MANQDSLTGGVAVLASGGLDSTVLLADQLARGRRVQPVHVRCGFSWEDAEARTLTRLLALPPLAGRLPAVVTVTVDARDRYPADHWARLGMPPAFDSPDEDVYLEDRNRLLITHAAPWCRRLGVTHRLLGAALGVPLAVTLSCMNPQEGDRPCLACSKCRERQDAMAG